MPNINFKDGKFKTKDKDLKKALSNDNKIKSDWKHSIDDIKDKYGDKQFHCFFKNFIKT